MAQITDFEVTEAMIVYGGSFVAALGRAYRCADGDNQEKLKRTFSDYWKQFSELAKVKKSVS